MQNDLNIIQTQSLYKCGKQKENIYEKICYWIVYAGNC